MDNTNAILIYPFYQCLLQDFESLLPDIDFSYEKELLAMPDPSLAKCHALVRRFTEMGKAIERSLVTPEILEVPSYFERQSDTNLPRMFYPLFKEVFHESGLRRFSEPDSLDRETGSRTALAVLLLRQWFLAFSKVEDIEPEVDLQEEINAFNQRVTTPGQPCCLDPVVSSIARRLLRSVLCEDPDDPDSLSAEIAQWVENPFGRHGPGAVAEKEEGAEKWHFNLIPGLPSKLFDYHPGMPVTNGLAREVLPEARLAVVPKDLRGHRLICIEPKELQFAQQGLMQILYDRVHRHFLAGRSIDFSNQEKSQRLSRDLNYATIDLKDASDSLKIEVLRVLLPRRFYRLVSSFRSRFVQLPSGEVISPRTMFTMGNALCFPIETLVFWAVALAAVIVENDLDESEIRLVIDQYPLISSYTEAMKVGPNAFRDFLTQRAYARRKLLRKLKVRVFGDDIIVPIETFPFVCDCLTRIGCTVNPAKSCSDTQVRESCGSWYYAGRDVTITRFRVHKLSDTRAWVSLLANCKELQGNGFSTAALGLLRNLAEMHPVPFGMSGLPGQINVESGYRWNRELQRLEFRMPVISDYTGLEVLPGYASLYAKFTRQATVTARHGHPKVEWRWVEVRLGLES